MPYIQENERGKLNKAVAELKDALGSNPSVGELNYCISSLLWSIWRRNQPYTLANNLIGVLECVKQEFHRRLLSPYEDKKIAENGDL